MLNFIFTKKGVNVDNIDSSDKTAEAFEHDKYSALYSMGFSEKHKDLSASREYMWLLVTEFLKNLTELPEIELVREHAEPRLSDISAERLLNAVPFALGAEYINKNGLRIYLKSLRKYLHRR